MFSPTPVPAFSAIYYCLGPHLKPAPPLCTQGLTSWWLKGTTQTIFSNFQFFLLLDRSHQHTKILKYCLFKKQKTKKPSSFDPVLPVTTPLLCSSKCYVLAVWFLFSLSLKPTPIKHLGSPHSSKAVCKVTNDPLNAKSTGQFWILIFQDFMTAFERVHHSVLFEPVFSLGFQDSILSGSHPIFQVTLS